jgi:lipopolysaccharide/colanic/teichoic acid biosynthesis glycosyltransferase
MFEVSLIKCTTLTERDNYYKKYFFIVVNKLYSIIMTLTKADIEHSLGQKKLQIIIKRLFDIIFAVVLIILFFPLLIVVALLIKLSSRGPVLYANDRIGYRGIHFKCLKFRSMRAGKPDAAHVLKAQEEGILYKPKKDDRITWIGGIIRKTSIDELPQLFNVVKGEMSIVGPRPLVPFMMTHLHDFNEIRCLVRPGITGLWQIEDRANNTSASYMIQPDLNYISNYNLLSDFKILVKTPLVVISAKGAH